MERRGRGGRPARHAGRRDLEDLLRGPAAGSMVLHQGTTQGKPAEGWPEVKEFFEFDRRGTGYRQGILAGLTTVKVMGYSWQTALGAVFIAGVLFTLLTVLKIRGWLAEAIPLSLKFSFSVGIGLFLAFIGLNETRLVRLGVPGAPVSLGDLGQPSALLAIFTFFLIVFLVIRRIPGAVIIGVLATTFLSFFLGLTSPPSQWISVHPAPPPILLTLEIAGALHASFFPVILTIF